VCALLPVLEEDPAGALVQAHPVLSPQAGSPASHTPIPAKFSLKPGLAKS